ncbi:MAG: hypothetical protein LAT83_12215 [Kiritimatiellae bacterium]|nr:hypothetical protein [Kiritimatiellia bacterium]
MSPDPIRFRPATASDLPGIHDLLRATPLPGRVRLCFEPQRVSEKEHLTLVAARASDPGRFAGLAERAVHRVWLDGQPVSIGYLGQLRKRPGETLSVRRLAEGFRLIDASRAPDQLPFDYTAILEENVASLRLLTRKLPGLPVYTPCGEMVTLTFSTRRPAPRREIRQMAPTPELSAWIQDKLKSRPLGTRIPSDASLPFWSAWDGGEPAGAVALWDRRASRPLRVHGYAPGLARTRRLLNPVRALTRFPRLPPPGGTLELAFLSFLVAKDDDPAVMTDLIRAACRGARARGIELLSLGLPATHPALPALRRNLKPEILRSRLFWVHPPDAPPPAPASAPHPEVAIL